MSTPRIPRTDSIQELAQFWDTHDVTDFQDELEEVTDTVFEREKTCEIRLHPKELELVEGIAKSEGIGLTDLIRKWVLEKIHLC